MAFKSGTCGCGARGRAAYVRPGDGAAACSVAGALAPGPKDGKEPAAEALLPATAWPSHPFGGVG